MENLGRAKARLEPFAYCEFKFKKASIKLLAS